MQTSLIEALRVTPIIHPTKILSMTMVAREIPSTTYSATDLRVRLFGNSWWKPDRKERADAPYEFVFEDLYDGTLDVNAMADSFDEALEDFDIQSLADVDWAQSNEHQIFCSSPLKDPIALYMALQDFLVRADSYKRPEDFLNWQSTLRQFVALTSSNSYLVARGPESICKVIWDELERQGVAHNLVEGYRVATDVRCASGVWVRLGGSSFLCRAASIAVLE